MPTRYYSDHDAQIQSSQYPSSNYDFSNNTSSHKHKSSLPTSHKHKSSLPTSHHHHQHSQQYNLSHNQHQNHPHHHERHHHRESTSSSTVQSNTTSRSTTSTSSSGSASSSSSSHPAIGNNLIKDAVLKAQELTPTAEIAEWAHQMHIQQRRSYWWCQSCFPKTMAEPLVIPAAVEKAVTGRRVRMAEPTHAYE